jgi:6-phosphogluconate dehydrogenase
LAGGNAYFPDTQRRNKELQAKGLRFIGAGVSGGEEGALKGPAIMPGGQKSAYELVEPTLTAISAKVNGDACSTYIGEQRGCRLICCSAKGLFWGAYVRATGSKGKFPFPMDWEYS